RRLLVGRLIVWFLVRRLGIRFLVRRFGVCRLRVAGLFAQDLLQLFLLFIGEDRGDLFALLLGQLVKLLTQVVDLGSIFFLNSVDFLLLFFTEPKLTVVLRQLLVLAFVLLVLAGDGRRAEQEDGGQ